MEHWNCENDDLNIVEKEMSFIEKDMMYDMWDKYYGNPPYSYDVYALTDGGKPGRYQYDSLIFNHEPFYIGSGQRRKRMLESMKLGRQLDKYCHKVKRMIEIDKRGDVVRGVVIGSFYTKTKSLMVEKKILNLIPRNILTNTLSPLCEIPLCKEDYNFMYKNKLLIL